MAYSLESTKFSLNHCTKPCLMKLKYNILQINNRANKS